MENRKEVESGHRDTFRSHRNRGSAMSNNALITAIRGAYITNHINNNYGRELYSTIHTRHSMQSVIAPSQQVQKVT